VLTGQYVSPGPQRDALILSWKHTDVVSFCVRKGI